MALFKPDPSGETIAARAREVSTVHEFGYGQITGRVLSAPAQDGVREQTQFWCQIGVRNRCKTPIPKENRRHRMH